MLKPLQQAFYDFKAQSTSLSIRQFLVVYFFRFVDDHPLIKRYIDKAVPLPCDINIPQNVRDAYELVFFYRLLLELDGEVSLNENIHRSGVEKYLYAMYFDASASMEDLKNEIAQIMTGERDDDLMGAFEVILLDLVFAYEKNQFEPPSIHQMGSFQTLLPKELRPTIEYDYGYPILRGGVPGTYKPNQGGFPYYVFLYAAEHKTLLIEKAFLREKVGTGDKKKVDWDQCIKNFRKLIKKRYEIPSDFWVLKEHDEQYLKLDKSFFNPER